MENSSPVHTQFFGDAERDFRLTPDLVLELERKTDTGIGSISRRFYSADFRLSELQHIARLALIGGGTDPEEADALVTTYVPLMSITKLYEMLIAVMDNLMFGKVSTDAE